MRREKFRTREDVYQFVETVFEKRVGGEGGNDVFEHHVVASDFHGTECVVLQGRLSRFHRWMEDLPIKAKSQVGGADAVPTGLADDRGDSNGRSR